MNKRTNLMFPVILIIAMLVVYFMPSALNQLRTHDNSRDTFVEHSVFAAAPMSVSSLGCDSQFPVLGSVYITSQMVGYSSPNGEVVTASDGSILQLLHDVDQDGRDEYLIFDVAEDVDGTQWYGLFVGGCELVYVPVNQASLVRAVPDLFSFFGG